jgi:opacity protein-like surface antigen
MKKLLLLLTLAPCIAFGQEAIPATGSDATGSGGIVSYTVGQVVYTTNTGTNASVTQGVQQPYEISVTVGLEATGINLECMVYPNPATDVIKLIVEDYYSKNLSYQLYNIQGKLLASKKITGISSTVIMESLPTSTYFLKVMDNQIELKAFRIIKN